jgi:hypothetical protein
LRQDAEISTRDSSGERIGDPKIIRFMRSHICIQRFVPRLLTCGVEEVFESVEPMKLEDMRKKKSQGRTESKKRKQRDKTPRFPN